MKTVLQSLRTRTRDVHERLHHHPVMKTLQDERLSKKEYFRILFWIRNFYLDISEILHINNRSCPIVTKDIGRLSLDLTAHSVACDADAYLYSAPKRAVWKRTISDDDYLGMRYVIQGSHLGGKVISKKIQKNLGLTPQSGVAFYNGDGKETRKNWNSFLKQLDDSHIDVENCCRSAEFLFKSMENHLWNLQND